MLTNRTTKIIFSILCFCGRAGFGQVDTLAPTVYSVSVQPKLVKIGEPLQIELTADDDVSGIEIIFVRFVDSRGTDNFLSSLIIQNPTEKKIRRSVTIPQYAPAGIWRVNSISARDRAKNTKHIVSSDPILRNATFEVMSNLVDAKAPHIAKINLSAKKVKVGDSITFELIGEDDKSGIDLAIMRILDPLGNEGVRAVFFSPSPEGKMRAQITIPPFSKNGFWTINSLRVRDRAKNLAQRQLLLLYRAWQVRADDTSLLQEPQTKKQSPAQTGMEDFLLPL